MSTDGPGTEPTAGSRRTRRARRLRRPVRLVAAALAVAAAVGIWSTGLVKHVGTDLLGSALSAVAPPTDKASPAVYRAGDPITVLVMGTEDAPAYASPKLTDSMMVLAFDPSQQKAAMLSVPRDLWVDIPGVGYQRINAAYEDGGPPTAALTVERYVGVPVEYYAMVSYPAFVKLVNDVGGIDVNVPYAINDTCFPNPAENACTVLHIAKGPQHMNGTQALDFARERHVLPNGDLTREADQQLVLFALRKALLKPGNLLRLPAIVNDLRNLVTTNLPMTDLVKLGEEVVHLPRSAIQHAVPNYANGSVSDAVTTGGADVLLLHLAALHRLVTRVFGPALSHMGEATVQVENGAPTQQDLATYFSHVLDGMGATTLAPEQAAHTDHHANEVFWNTAVSGGTPPPALAYMLAQMLDTRMVAAPRTKSTAQIVVVLGSVFPKVEGGSSNPSIAPNPPAGASGTAPKKAGVKQGKGAVSSTAAGAGAAPGQPSGRPRSGPAGTGQKSSGQAQTAPGGVVLPGVPSPAIQSPSGIEVAPRIGLPAAVGGSGSTAAGARPPASGASGSTSGSTSGSASRSASGSSAGSTASTAASGQAPAPSKGQTDTQAGGTAVPTSSSSASAGVVTAATVPSTGTTTQARAGSSPVATHASA